MEPLSMEQKNVWTFLFPNFSFLIGNWKLRKYGVGRARSKRWGRPNSSDSPPPMVTIVFQNKVVEDISALICWNSVFRRLTPNGNEASHGITKKVTNMLGKLARYSRRHPTPGEEKKKQHHPDSLTVLECFLSSWWCE